MDHDAGGVIIALFFWAALVAVFFGPVYLRYRDRGRLHETLRIAYEKGHPVPPELIAALQSSAGPPLPSTPERDLRRAVVLIAVGLGFCGLGYGLWYGLMSVNEMSAYISGGCTAGLGAIPGMIGLAYLVLWAARRNAPRT